MGIEAGYQILLTSFSGTSGSALSGNDLFPLLLTDNGVAGTLASMEFRAFSPDL